MLWNPKHSDTVSFLNYHITLEKNQDEYAGRGAKAHHLVLNHFCDSISLTMQCQVQLQLMYFRTMRAYFSGIHLLSFPQYKIIRFKYWYNKKKLWVDPSIVTWIPKMSNH